MLFVQSLHISLILPVTPFHALKVLHHPRSSANSNIIHSADVICMQTSSPTKTRFSVGGRMCTDNAKAHSTRQLYAPFKCWSVFVSNLWYAGISDTDSLTLPDWMTRRPCICETLSVFSLLIELFLACVCVCACEARITQFESKWVKAQAQINASTPLRYTVTHSFWYLMLIIHTVAHW